MTSSIASGNAQNSTWILRLGQALRAMASRPSGAMAVSTSPGRMAAPSGMFSTKPIMPMTFAFALRAASTSALLALRRGGVSSPCACRCSARA